MKNIEKDILLKDLDYMYTELELKKDKLNSIISLYLDEEPASMSDNINDKIKKTEEEVKKIIEEEEKKESDEINEDNIEEDIEEDNSDEKEIDEIPQDIKTLYRKIVMKIHPDKNKKSSYNDLYKSLYKRVVESKNNNNKSDIIYIAYKLKLNDVYNLDPTHFGSIKKKIKEIEMESTNLTYDSYWVWYHTDNKQLKKVMVSQINQSIPKRY